MKKSLNGETISIYILVHSYYLDNRVCMYRIVYKGAFLFLPQCPLL